MAVKFPPPTVFANLSENTMRVVYFMDTLPILLMPEGKEFAQCVSIIGEKKFSACASFLAGMYEAACGKEARRGPFPSFHGPGRFRPRVRSKKPRQREKKSSVHVVGPVGDRDSRHSPYKSVNRISRECSLGRPLPKGALLIAKSSIPRRPSPFPRRNPARKLPSAFFSLPRTSGRPWAGGGGTKSMLTNRRAVGEISAEPSMAREGPVVGGRDIFSAYTAGLAAFIPCWVRRRHKCDWPFFSGKNKLAEGARFARKTDVRAMIVARGARAAFRAQKIEHGPCR